MCSREASFDALGGYGVISDEIAKAYRGNYVPGGGYPIALVAAGHRYAQLVAEYFLFVGDKESTFFSQRIVADPGSIGADDPDNPQALAPSFLLDFAAFAAEERLNNHLYEVNKANPQPGFWDRPYKLAAIPLEELAFLRLQDKYTQQIEEVTENTCFPRLSKLVNQVYRIGRASFKEPR